MEVEDVHGSSPSQAFVDTIQYGPQDKYTLPTKVPNLHDIYVGKEPIYRREQCRRTIISISSTQVQQRHYNRQWKSYFRAGQEDCEVGKNHFLPPLFVLSTNHCPLLAKAYASNKNSNHYTVVYKVHLAAQTDQQPLRIAGLVPGWHAMRCDNVEAMPARHC